MKGFIREFLEYMSTGVDVDSDWETYMTELGDSGSRNWTLCMLLWIRFAQDANFDQYVLGKWFTACNNKPSQDLLLETLSSCEVKIAFIITRKEIV